MGAISSSASEFNDFAGNPKNKFDDFVVKG